MHWRKCTILKHTSRQGSHYDWLMENPASASFTRDELWAARVTMPPELWLDAGRLMLTPLAAHRRKYLTYQGPVSQGRGHVLQIARARVLPWRWSQGSCHLLVHWLDDSRLPMHVHLTPHAIAHVRPATAT